MILGSLNQKFLNCLQRALANHLLKMYNIHQELVLKAVMTNCECMTVAI